MNIDSKIIKILERLNDKGYEAYIVGGATRDLLLGKKVDDFDITTNASSNTIKMLFDDYPMYDIGKSLGTVTLLANPYKVDITPYRIEGDYVNHRRPSTVNFSLNLEDDLIRRDFTINSLCLSKDGEIIDLFGGLNDLNSKTIKAIGNPDQRFNEDALRILRAIRFKASLCFDIEENTKASILNNKNLLISISNERKKEELLKTLSFSNTSSLLLEYKEVFDTFIHLNVTDKTNSLTNPYYSLSLMLNDTKQLKALTFSKHEIALIDSLIQAIPLDINNDYDFITTLSDGNFQKEILSFLEKIHNISLQDKFNSLKPYIATINELDINGYDLINLGYEGQQIRIIKEKILEQIHLQMLDNKKEAILDFLKSPI